ncbi:hypothetical protein NH340_JMT01761 [Sarcoptes scabiei]|nr:hypothetical protein NH340_JMT01761 [Sarcoptes scabiei]
MLLTIEDGQFSTNPNDSIALGICSRPNIPPNGKIRFVSTEKIRFAENETIYMLCDEHSFPHHLQKRTCRHGSWTGPQARCGKAVVIKVNRLQAFRCDDPRRSLLSLSLNQSDETKYPLPPNSFHFMRIDEDINLIVNGSDCYRWIVSFEEPIEIQFLLVDLNSPKSDTIKQKPSLEIKIKNRNCSLEHSSYQMIETEEIFGNYFFCDPENRYLKFYPDENLIKTDSFEIIMKTHGNRSIGLEAIFVGETYKKVMKHAGNKLTTDCGRLEIQRTGVLEQAELGHTVIKCNESFSSIDSSKKFIYTCNSNGMWQGEWPMCLPKQTCPKSDILDNLDSSVQIENINNVYYYNDSEWLAVDLTWVQYTCVHHEGILVGKNERTCLNGKWTNKNPYCMHELNSGSFTISIIIAILIVLIIIFSLIVYVSIRSHSRKIAKKLESTKNEIEEKALNKQISTDFYSDIGLETIYEDCKEIYSIPMYEIPDEIRYEPNPHLPSSSSPRTAMNKPINSIEPEYLAMTEGTLKRNQNLKSNQSTAFSNNHNQMVVYE